jgi:hypothetical protein
MRGIVMRGLNFPAVITIHEWRGIVSSCAGRKVRVYNV